MNNDNHWLYTNLPHADRHSILLEYSRKSQRGIEVGPYYSPLTPKAAGWNVLSLDVYNKLELQQRASRDPNIPAPLVANIEDVDLIGPAHRLAELVERAGALGQIDFILSSHNFEHLPNPIGFFQSCARVLKSGGVLSMAIPDKRCCFDYFRPVSTVGELLEAHFEQRDRPSLRQLYDAAALSSRFRGEEGGTGHDLADDPREIVGLRQVEEAYDAWRSSLASVLEDSVYVDCHCWTFTPNSFRLILLDLLWLRLLPLRPLKVYDTQGNEFYVHMTRDDNWLSRPISADDYYSERQRLLHAANSDLAVNALRVNEATGLQPARGLRMHVEAVARARNRVRRLGRA